MPGAVLEVDLSVAYLAQQHKVGILRQNYYVCQGSCP